MQTFLIVNTLLALILGYSIGCVNPAYLLAKRRGFDIREEGSGNAGATNAGLTMGRNVGVMIAAFDVAKACCAIWLAKQLLPAFALAAEIAGTSCVLGHMFPFYMRFRGGKGLACFAGILLSFHPAALFILFFIELIPAILIGYGCVFPILTAVLVPILYAFLTGKLVGALVYAVASAAMIAKHRINIRRIIAGEELPIKLLWSGRDPK